MTGSEIFFLILLCLTVLLLVRNHVTYRIRLRAGEIVDQMCREAIQAGRPWERLWALYDARSYDGIMFDLTCWTVRQAYPGLIEQPKAGQHD